MKPYKLKLSQNEKSLVVFSLQELLESPKIYWGNNVWEIEDETYREIKELINRIEQL